MYREIGYLLIRLKLSLHTVIPSDCHAERVLLYENLGPLQQMLMHGISLYNKHLKGEWRYVLEYVYLGTLLAAFGSGVIV